MSDENTPKPSGDDEGPLLPPQAQLWVDKTLSVWRRLPMAAKVFAGALVATGMVVGAYFAFAPMVRGDAVLVSGIEQEDAAAIVEVLKAQAVPYEIAANGTTILVPEDRVAELKMSIAAEGLIRGGQAGFENFENMRLGATEFEQHVIYRRAMEGELARTIATVASVQSARVHLVMPRKSVFAQKREPASASIIVSLTGGEMERGEVRGVVNLVASAVPGLTPDQITLVTSDGRMLNRPTAGGDGEADGFGAGEAEHVGKSRALEINLEERARSILERIIGPGHVEVRVSAVLDTAKVERKTDTYDSEKPAAMRSEQSLEERLGGAVGGRDNVAGVPGAESNLPGAAAVVGEAAEQNNAGIVRHSHTRNFEVDRVQERRVSVTQDVKRLTVAVAINDKVKTADGEFIPHDKESIADFEELVKNAVGFDADRGDQITLTEAAFFVHDMPEAVAAPDTLPIPAAYKPLVDKWLPLAKIVGAGLLGLIVLLWIRRRVRKVFGAIKERNRKLLEAAEAAAQLPVGASDADIDKALAEASQDDDEATLPEVDFRVEALSRAQDDPATAALVVRSWLNAPPNPSPDIAA